MIEEFRDLLPGGLADMRVPGDFNLDQLKKGIKHELEHTTNPAIAREIAMDHLAEDPKYYDKLQAIEEMRFVVRQIIKEVWSQHLDNVMDAGDDLPWNNEEPGSDPDDPNNPANIYNANDSLNKVKPSVPGAAQKAGVGRGSGPAGGSSRRPGGNRI